MFAYFFLLFTGSAGAVDTASALLLKADGLRNVNYDEFSNISEALQKREETLTPEQHEYLQYLQGWKSAYDGDATAALARLTTLADSSKDVTLRMRANATAVNMLVHGKRYAEAFARLSGVLQLLSSVTDERARQQALLSAAELYSSVGQYDLSLDYSQQVIDANWANRGLCEGWESKLESLYHSGRIEAPGPELKTGVDACGVAGEINFANSMRLFAAKWFVQRTKYDDAIELLQQHYAEVRSSHNPLFIATWDAALADTYRKKGVPTLALTYATHIIERAGRYEYTEPLATAYSVLYEIAKQRGEYKAALEYHEQFQRIDKAYLTDLGTRHLAYQKINHENIANQLKVDALNKQNHVLQLERQLGSQAVETSRLYILLLLMTVVFIALWAYRTKRSQLYFQTLSRLDGLTGICNRPYFIALADKALEATRRNGGHVCIVLCDLDHFKQINDRYGHATGDFVLKRTVAVCSEHLSKNTTFGRFGGEEFAILLPDCSPEEARQRAEQLRLAIAGITVYEGDTVRVTVSASFGIASSVASGLELGQLLAHADVALYEAKRLGRNRIVLHVSSQTDVPSASVVSSIEELVQHNRRSSCST